MIRNYAELKTSIAGWLTRTDLTTRIPDFITLLESSLGRILPARAYEAESTLTATVGSRYIALPADYVEPLALWLTVRSPREELTQKTPLSIVVRGDSGEPGAWCIDGENIALDIVAAGGYTFAFRYRQKKNLADTDTNWVLTNHPDAYLFGSLLEAAPFLKDDSRIALWQSRYDRAIAEITEKEKRSQSGVKLSTDLAGMSGEAYDITRG